MSYYNGYYSNSHDFTITKREVIFSVIIIAIMMGIGIIIGNHITKKIHDKNEIYSKSVTIDSNEMFKYGIDTNIGDSFSYGKLFAVDTVDMDDLHGYMYIARELEEYTKHYRTVTETHRRSDGTTYTTHRREEYWTWDHVRTDTKHNVKVNFCGVEFFTKDFPIPSSYHLKTVSCGYHKRYNYSVIDNEYVGTLFADLDNHYISKERVEPKFMKNVNIENALEEFTIPTQFVLFFWIPWIILTIVLVIVFYYVDNKWLED